jgi:hypothetical protein
MSLASLLSLMSLWSLNKNKPVYLPFHYFTTLLTHPNLEIVLVLVLVLEKKVSSLNYRLLITWGENGGHKGPKRLKGPKGSPFTAANSCRFLHWVTVAHFTFLAYNE